MPDEVPRATAEMPKLDAFDQEFGGELPAAISDEPRRKAVRALAGVLVAAAIVGVPALAWFYADGLPLRGSMSPAGEQRTDAAAEVDRLTREVAALKQEIRDLTAAQQQSAEVIASLQAAGEDARNPPAYWWSEHAMLHLGDEPPAPSAAAPRRAPTAREAPRTREPGAPLSLEPPQ
jgi:hypothetical protein